MALGLLGKKIGMTRVFDNNGDVVVTTLLEVGPCKIVQIKNKQSDGYNAIQLGLIDKKEKSTTKPLMGHFKRANVTPKRFLRENRVEDVDKYQVGQELKVDIFKPGDYVDISGISKGRGFAGVVKRWGFRGGKQSHGSRFHRAPGSIGAAASPSRVFKGKKLPGHMGNEKTTIQNLKVVEVHPDKNQMLVKGSVPGPSNGMLFIRKSVKKSTK